MITACLLLLSYLLFIHANTNENKTNTLKTIFWMHIQKTSSWLGDFLLLYGCPSFHLKIPSKDIKMMYGTIARSVNNIGCDVKFYTGEHGYGYHIPFSLSTNQSTITLFRNPYDRIISSFLHGKGIHQMMFPLGFPKRVKLKYILRQNISNTEFPILTYANLNGMKGCQTKMMLGYDCGVDIILTNKDLNEAKRRLQYDMAFFGITEESEASAKLFLTTYPSLKLTTTTLELIHEYTYKLKPRKNKAHHTESNERYHSILKSHGWKDYYDQELYTYAKEIFYYKCKLYEIKTKYDH